jgi:Na+/melibiose symporter-like transporter
VRAIRGALGQRGLRLVLGAGLVSLTGDWVLRVGLAYFVYALTGSTVASALILLASFVPQVVLGSLAGVFVDRWDLRRTMVVSNLALALGLLPLLLVHHSGQMWIVYLVLTWEGCVQQFFAPAEQAALPLLAGDEHLLTANALGSQNRDLSRLVGSAIGGILAAASGMAAIALVDLASFAVAAALIAGVALPARAARATEAGASLRGRIRELGAEWNEGLRLATRQRVLRTLLLFLLITCIGEGIMGTLFAPFVRSVLHGSGSAYGLIVAVQAIGGIAGGLLAASAGDRLDPAKALGLAAMAFGACDLCMFLYPLIWSAVWPAGVFIAMAGVPGAFVIASAMTLLQRNASEAHRGRVFGALGTAEGVAVVAGIAAAGVLGKTIGIQPLLVAQGAGYVLAGVFVLGALRGAPGATRMATAPGSSRA